MRRYCVVFVALFFILPSVFGQIAQFQVTSLTCTDVAVGGTFSCTATILNAGDYAATPGTFSLFPDSSDWLEKNSYTLPGTTVDNGETVEIAFTGLKAVKSGNANGFSNIKIDDVTDTSSSVTGLKVNAVDVAVDVTTSPSTAAQGGTFTATAEVTAGGNVDITLTFAVDSGGCSIGNQDNQKNVTGMKHGNKQSRTWTVTQGSGDCKFTITATATGSGTKTDTSTGSVTCTNCGGAGGGAAAGGGGGGAAVKIALGELTSSVTQDLARGEKVTFTLGGESHSVSVTSLTETTAALVIQSHPQKVTMTVGEEKSFDVNDDGKNDISVKLNSLNVLTKKIKITLTPLQVQPQQPSPSAEGGSETTTPSGGGEQPGTAGPTSGGTGTGLVTKEEVGSRVRGWLFAAIILAVLVAFVVILVLRRKRY